MAGPPCRIGKGCCKRKPILPFLPCGKFGCAGNAAWGAHLAAVTIPGRINCPLREAHVQHDTASIQGKGIVTLTVALITVPPCACRICSRLQESELFPEGAGAAHCQLLPLILSALLPFRSRPCPGGGAELRREAAAASRPRPREPTPDRAQQAVEEASGSPWHQRYQPLVPSPGTFQAPGGGGAGGVSLAPDPQCWGRQKSSQASR